MSDYNQRVINESIQVHNTEYWRKYIQEILQKRKLALRKCCEVTEDHRYWQGQIEMVDLILALPKKMKKDLERGVA